MTASPGPDRTTGRPPRQRRSRETRGKIVEAAIAILAERGVGRLTHRAVARQAGVSLAATTYYFATRFDIITEASRHLLTGYLQSFARVAASGAPKPPSFRAFAIRLLGRVAGREQMRTIAWCEIMLNAAHHPELRSVAEQWYDSLAAAWRSIAATLGDGRSAGDAQPAIDTGSGLLFMIVALGLTENQVSAVLAGGDDPIAAWCGAPVEGRAENQPGAGKAGQTRERIIAAAIDQLLEGGPGSLTHQSVATRSGLTVGAPAYHFDSIQKLLAIAQARLFRASKTRYRDTMAGVDLKALGRDQLIDLTTTVFVREATEFARFNLASHLIWIEAARRPELRPMIREVLEDQYQAWSRILLQLRPAPRPLDAILVQALFLGKLIRMLSTGAPTATLARVRGEFDRDLRALLNHDFWL